MENHGQKRSASEQNDTLDGVKAILLDVEGTTTPISFVQDKLFSYIRDNVKSYFESNWEKEECQQDVTACRAQAKKDKEAEVKDFVDIPAEDDNQEAVIEALVANVLWQMDENRKVTALKTLQGHMWREAYKTSKIQGELFDDVVPAIKDWIAQDLKVYIYSSGSVEAQKLLFGYSEKGDLQELFSGYFDTSVGAKAEKESYVKIAEQVDVKPAEILFITDVTAEAEASCDAGYKVCVVEREGNADIADEDRQKYNIISSFGELRAPVDEPVPAKKVAEEPAEQVAEENGQTATA